MLAGPKNVSRQDNREIQTDFKGHWISDWIIYLSYAADLWMHSDTAWCYNTVKLSSALCPELIINREQTSNVPYRKRI